VKFWISTLFELILITLPANLPSMIVFVLFSPIRIIDLSITKFSWYVPFPTYMISPVLALSIAS